MLVHFKFYRCGYMCNGLIEHENLDAAAEALWKEHPSTFKWIPNGGPKEENRLTIEEYKNEQGSTEQVESEARPGGPVGI
jgi:hypothetical protein